MKKFIYEIKQEGNLLVNLTEEELNLEIRKTRKRFSSFLNSSFTPSSELIVKWFSLVQEVSRRTIGLKHFDTQLCAGLLLHQGKIVEMKTGEGKTLASTLPIALNALSEKGVHVVTVNDYLAERDQKWMGKVYAGLGLSVGLVKTTSGIREKQRSYGSEITYVTNSELVFDYLRDSSAYTLNQTVLRPFDYCIIDEIDSILIDEARTPLILSSVRGEVNLNKLSLAKATALLLERDFDFEMDEKRRDIHLTEKGYQKAKSLLAKESLYDVDDPWILELLNALKAQYIFQRNKDYILLQNKVCIVDEFTGRIMEDRRWSLGIHEAVEMKENVELGGETKTKSSITYQNFFTLYPKLAGMTGTAKTAEKEFQDIYGLEVVVLPTSKPLIRKDLSDFVYQDEFSKWKAVLKQSESCFQKGQPILIGTATVEKSEFLSELFEASQIPHQVLNAKPENVFRESEIVAQAGQRASVTIATNMAGRGTDIILGGNPIYQMKQFCTQLFLETEEPSEISSPFLPLENQEEMIQQVSEEYRFKETEFTSLILELPYSLERALPSFQHFYSVLSKKVYSLWEVENQKVKELGGLFVLGTERHETRRIDNQLRGRAGRQGDPGASQFFVCLDDELIKVFGGESIRKWVEYLIDEKDVPLESDLLTKSLENAQQKVELYNYDIRKNVFQYDNILNTQRKQLFAARQEMLVQNPFSDLFLRSAEATFDQLISCFQELGPQIRNDFRFWVPKTNFEEILDAYSSYRQFPGSLSFSSVLEKNSPLENYSEIWISQDLRFASTNCYQNGFLQVTRSVTLLEIVDFYWTEHLERMSYIRETINWRSYGQQNPLVEYNSEAFESFTSMLEQIRLTLLYYFLQNSFI